jgi:hypothetical protein
MNSSSQKQWRALQQQLQALFSELERYSHAVLNASPGPGKWSAMQVLQHLLRSETLSLGYLQKKWSYSPELKPASFRTRWREFILASYLGVPIKFKAPKGVNEEHFPEESDFSATRKQWLETRKEMEAFLSELPNEVFEKEFYRHPIAGRITIPGMLRFFERHTQRHLGQIRKTLETITQ